MAELYFQKCKPHEEEVEGGEEGETRTHWGEPPSCFGLANACGVLLETLNEYGSGKYDSDDNDFSASVKWWKQQVKHFAEKGLYEARNAAGPIFHLTQLTRNDPEPWRNVTQSEIGGIDGKPVEFRQFMESLGKDAA